MLRLHALIIGVIMVLGICGGIDAKELTLYSGRSKSLVEPIIEQFETETQIKVKVRYGGTAELAVALLEEGENSPADLFWAQDAGALGAISKRGLFQKLPDGIASDVPEKFRDSEGMWVATSGRARVIAYSSEHIKAEEAPASIFDLTDPKWEGRVGWAPQNGSFQAFVTSMRVGVGEKKTEEWLRGMKANKTKNYPKNTPIVKALAAGEIHLGLPNHYYLLRFKNTDAEFPVEQTFFKPGDPGNLVNVAGIGHLKTSRHPEQALALIEFLLSPQAQQYFVAKVFEYPVTNSPVPNPNPKLIPLSELLERTPKINLGDLDDLEGTLKLLRKVGIL